MSTKADYTAEEEIMKAISVKVIFWKDIGITYGQNHDK